MVAGSGFPVYSEFDDMYLCTSLLIVQVAGYLFSTQETRVDILVHETKMLEYKYNWAASTNLVLIACASSKGSGKPAHPRSLARTSAARSYKQWVKKNLHTESQIPGLSGWLGMRS